MGIQGLLPLLKSIQKPCSLKKFAGQTIGVDAYGWLHRGTIACVIELAMDKPTRKFVDYAMHRVRMLQHFGIVPYIVFDGDYLPSKAATEAERAKKRQESKKLGLDLLRAGKTHQAYQELQKAIDVTPEMARLLIDELRKLGVQYVVAPYEADAQMVYLERKGLVSAILSEDSDLLVFGAKCLLTKLDQYGNCIEINKKDFCSCREINLTGWSDAEFRCMAILSGCDYLNSVGNMGLKTAHRMVRKYKKIEKILRMLQFDGKHNIPKNYLEAFYQAELTFLHQRVFCPILNKLVFHTEPIQPIDEQKMLFIGANVEPDIARSVAAGRLNPMTKQPMFTGQDLANNPARYSQAVPKPQPRRVATSDDLKKGVSIEQFFRPQKRIPLGELDPNSFTPSPTQQNALLRNAGSWSAEPISRQYLPQPNNNTQPEPQPTSTSTNRRAILRSTALSDTRPQKRSRLCADDPVVISLSENHRSNLVRSPFFDTPGSGMSPSIGRSSKAKRSKLDEIAIFSDDSIEDALLSLPDFGHWQGPKPCNKAIEIFDDVEFEQSRAHSEQTLEAVRDEHQGKDIVGVSQTTTPGLTQSSSILSLADEILTPGDNSNAKEVVDLNGKLSLTPTQSLFVPHLSQRSALAPSMKYSRIPRAVKPLIASTSARKSVQGRTLTPLQNLGAKALNRSARLPPTPPFTPQEISPAILFKFKQVPSSGATPLSGVPFLEVLHSRTSKAHRQFDPAKIPLPIPDKEEALSLSDSGRYPVNAKVLTAVLDEGTGSEDLIVRDSEEKLDDEISSPTETTGGAATPDLDRFSFKG